MSVLNTYKDFLMERYDNFPHGKYVTLLILRQAQSEVIFRTEGSGEGLSFDTVQSGLKNSEPMQRAVITKRKQVAVERRTGRELLREHDLLFYKGGAKKGKAEEICALNRNMPCEHCIDCMLYGFAAGGGGAQKSRVMTDDAFSLHPFAKVTAQRTFNGLFDNSTMRDPVDGSPSTSIQSDEYVKPGALFVDMQTLKDVTEGEMIYALANVMRSRRYGAISSRMGKMRNILVGVIFSDCELFSNLELTQAVYDRVTEDKATRDVWPLSAETAANYVSAAVGELLASVVGQKRPLSSTEVRKLEEEIAALYADPDSVKRLLTELTAGYPKNGR
ncbi:MAG: Type CRISPR-associated protein Cas7/Csc2 [Chthonomonadales bacterium]|nr:Type CRISPR-associated protein Cas7/Csc2 [Chthonomonadales bacterium]